VITRHNNGISTNDVNVLFFKATSLLLLPWTGDVCDDITQAGKGTDCQGVIKPRQSHFQGEGHESDLVSFRRGTLEQNTEKGMEEAATSVIFNNVLSCINITLLNYLI